jgi:DNA-binding transcriptional ArsR family regulator
MEKALWYLLAGTRGGTNRVRLVRAIDDRPRNANQLAGHLDLDYNTVRHHLDMLLEHDVVERSGDEYGALYFLTDRFDRHREEFERITERVEVEAREQAERETGTDRDADAKTED